MIRAVYFDAVGTLIHPKPVAGAVYRQVARRHGSSQHHLTFHRRFWTAFQKQELIDRENGWTTSERREFERWRTIVAEVLDDVSDPDACFAELYEHFAKPESWTCEPETEEVISELQHRGMVIGLASNYDHRLHTVVAGLAPLREIKNLVISSEVGWRKPAPAFFDAMIRQAGVPPADILYIGDDRVNDYDGARAAGLQALLLDLRGAVAHAGVRAVGHLGTLRDILNHPALI